MTREAIPSQLREAGLDALVAASFENVYYSSGALILTQRMIPTRLAFVVWTPEGDLTMVVCTIEEAQARKESWIEDIRGYVEFKQSPLAVLAQVLEDKGVAAGRIGVETRYLPARYYKELTERLAKATLVDGDEIFDRARVIKSDEEIARLEKAARATDRAIRIAFEGARLGTTEMQMAEVMASETLGGGADGIAFTVMTTGENSKMAHPTPSTTAIKPQDVVRTDFGGFFGSYFGGYFSDLARTAVAGEPRPRQRDTYQKLFEVHDLILRSVKPGARASDLYELCRKACEERELAFKSPHIGHNIGISIHEDPMLSPLCHDELQPNMVMAIEPITVEEGGIFHIEDMVLVTDKGCRPLSDPYQWAELMRIR